jgi:LDH2 family malate/lactate/ureidoglycolate dehydrogenase
MSAKTFRFEELHRFAREVFIHLGMRREDAAAAADSLVRADFEGNESHGISRLAIYAKRIREGRISAKPDIRTEVTGSIVKVDGGNGLGQVVSVRALEAAVPVARQNGMAGVFVRNSNHFGTAAYYCQKACEHNMALIAMTNSPPGIPPWGGRKAFFGTNPIAFGFPARNRTPVIVDMSSSVVARGKIILAGKTGESIPHGWAIDENGADTTDPAAALKGAVLPVGGAKGYALALAIEVMTGILTQAAFGPHVNNLYKDRDPPANVGHCFILLDIGTWLPMDEYFAQVERFLQEVKEVPLAQGSTEILYPGERRNRTFLKRIRQGITLPAEVHEELLRIGGEFGLTLSGT